MSDFKNVQPLEDFNWEEFENGTQAGTSKEETLKAYDETLNKVTEHQVVEGTVISVDKKEVIVNIGYKSDGIIPASEFRYNPELRPVIRSKFMSRTRKTRKASWFFHTRRRVWPRAGIV